MEIVGLLVAGRILDKVGGAQNMPSKSTYVRVCNVSILC